MPRLSLTFQIPAKYDKNTFTDIFNQIANQLNNLSEGKLYGRYYNNSIAPAVTAMPGAVSDIVWNKNATVQAASPNRYIVLGWINNVAGTPGTWQPLNIPIESSFTAWTSFTPSRTGWTDVGTPTVTGRYLQAGNLCFFQVKIVPATTTATTAGTSYIALPLTAGASGMGGDGSMENITTLIAVGACAFDVTNSRVYVPTQAATGNSLSVAGWFEV